MNTLRNSVQLIGRLGKDVELISLENGSKLAKFSLATSDYYKNNNGEKIEDTQWHNITIWGALAEQASNFLVKGNEVIVKGKLTYGSYKDKEGQNRYTTEIKVKEFFKITQKETVPF